MGHGDELVICDCNFPAVSTSRQTISQKLIVLTCSLPEAISAICSVLPLDYFLPRQGEYMAPQEGFDMPEEGRQVILESTNAINKYSSSSDVVAKVLPVERFQFYERSKKCYAVVQTLERRPYGNIILTKGCIGPDGNDLKP